MANTSSAHLFAPVHLASACIGGVEQICVQARPLHQQLQNPIRFFKWLRTKSEVLGFECYVHYEPTFQALPGSAVIQLQEEDYLLSLQMAITLAAAENTDRGQQLCRYLIAASSANNHTVPTCAAPHDLVNTITTAQAKALKQLADERAQHTRQHHQTIWTQLQHHFGVRSYFDLPADRFEQACNFLRRTTEPQPRALPNSHITGIEKTGLPVSAQSVVKRMSLDIAIDSLPLLRLILRNYIFQHADRGHLNDPGYIQNLLSPLRIEECLQWVNHHG